MRTYTRLRKMVYRWWAMMFMLTLATMFTGNHALAIVCIVLGFLTVVVSVISMFGIVISVGSDNTKENKK